MDKPEKALEDLSAIIELDPTDGAAYIRRWQVLQALGESVKAAADLAKGQALLPAEACEALRIPAG